MRSQRHVIGTQNRVSPEGWPGLFHARWSGAAVNRAYDFESEQFLVSLLKHEAQHTVDMKRFPEITPAELEYRAKLVELHYASDLGLLRKFLSEAEESRAGDSHAAASVRIRRDFADTDPGSLSRVQARALELLRAHTKEMEEKYGGGKAKSHG